jgi:hypothetical protein
MNLHEVVMKYGRLVVCIRHESAEIWGFRNGITLRIGTLPIMASTGVFVRVIVLSSALLVVSQRLQA